MNSEAFLIQLHEVTTELDKTKFWPYDGVKEHENNASNCDTASYEEDIGVNILNYFVRATVLLKSKPTGYTASKHR